MDAPHCYWINPLWWETILCLAFDVVRRVLMEDAAVMKGLEVLSTSDGAWYDVNLSNTRIVEWESDLYLRVCIR